MSKGKRNTALYDYLVSTGAFERGKEGIAQAKKQFRKDYLKAFKRKYAKTTKSFSISYSLDEVAKLQACADEYGISCGQWIKKAAVAYSKQTFVGVPSKPDIQRVLQLVMLCRNDIAQIAKNEQKVWFKGNRDYEELYASVNRMQTALEESLLKPMLLETYIEKQLREKPEFKNYLSTLLRNDI